MTIEKHELPDDIESLLLSNETVHYFSYIAFKGGCFRSVSRDNYWVMLTDARVLYRSKVMDGQSEVTKNGIVPLEKVSFLEVEEKSESGCTSKHFYFLRISSSGGTIALPLPTVEKGYEIRDAFSKMTQSLTGPRT